MGEVILVIALMVMNWRFGGLESTSFLAFSLSSTS